MSVGAIDVFGCTGLLTIAILLIYFGRTMYNNGSNALCVIFTGLGSFCLIALSIIMTGILKGVH